MANETVQLAEYAAALRYEDLPPEVVACARDAIIDTAAAAIQGSALPWSRIVIAYAERTGPGGEAAFSAMAAQVQAPAAALANGALAHAFELDSLTRPGAGAHPGATVFPPALAVAQQEGQGRQGADRGLCRRQRGDDPDRPRHRPHQRGARLSRAGHDRAVRRRGRLRPPARPRSGAHDQRDRHRRLARRRPPRIRARRRRHGQAAASRARLGGRRARGEPRCRRLRRAAHRARRRIRISAGVLHRIRRERADPRSRPRLRDAEHGPEALSVPRDGACRGQGGARPASRAPLLGRRGRGDHGDRHAAHGRAPQHPGAGRSDAGAVFDPVLRRAGAVPRGPRPRELRRERARRPWHPRPDAQGAARPGNRGRRPRRDGQHGDRDPGRRPPFRAP